MKQNKLKGQSLPLQVEVYRHFLFVTSFRNQSASQATGAKNRGQISQFPTPSVKF